MSHHFPTDETCLNKDVDKYVKNGTGICDCLTIQFTCLICQLVASAASIAWWRDILTTKESARKYQICARSFRYFTHLLKVYIGYKFEGKMALLGPHLLVRYERQLVEAYEQI